MSFISRGTRAAARPLRQTRTTSMRQSSRRNASSHDAHHEGAAHGESAHHADSGATGNEGFGKGFYITVASIPLLYLTYQLSKTQGNTVERWYRNYQDNLAKKEAQDVLHTQALEQAIADRALIFSEKADHARELRYTEFFNHGSPINVAAGHGTADLSKLKEHYDQQRRAMDSDRESRMAARASRQ